MQPGSQIGVYRIEGLLGQGGMAQVYKVWHTGLHRHEALKLLPPQMTFDRSFVERFLAEARTAAGLHHPHIATIHAVSDAQAAQPYFTMEMVGGGDLAGLMHQRGRLSLDEALPLLRQIGAALDYAHARRVIHRDIKPANILLQQEGGGLSVKVVDFGIARAQEAEGGARLTKTGLIVGTPEYMSPEQGGSGQPVDHRTDIYSLGIVAYEMLCGRPPFVAGQDGSVMTVIMSHIRETPRPPVEIAPGLPTDVNTAILKTLSKAPTDRFDTCDEFVRALSGDMAAGLAATPNSRDDRARTAVNEPSKASRTILGAIAAAAGLGVVMILIAIGNGGRGAEAPVKAALSAPASSPQTMHPDTPSPPDPPQPETVTVPDLVGQTEEEARASLRKVFLSADVSTSHSATVRAGSVIEQHPDTGASAAPDSPVRIVVSTGPSPESQVVHSVRHDLPRTTLPVMPTSSYSANDAQEVRNRYEEWLSAWQRMDQAGYMGFYSRQVAVTRPSGKSYGYEELARTAPKVWARQAYITITSNPPSISFENGRAVVRTHQHYDSTTYWDDGEKTLVWTRENGEWVIINESFAKTAGGAKR
jgi:tRNA A-37 threonylcarbamoyl transferase component Bud32